MSAGLIEQPLPWSLERMYAHDVDGKEFAFAYWIADANGLEVAKSIFDREVALQMRASPEMFVALKEAENALADYIPLIEETGAMLNFGHKVLAIVRAAIAKAEGK